MDRRLSRAAAAGRWVCPNRQSGMRAAASASTASEFAEDVRVLVRGRPVADLDQVLEKGGPLRERREVVRDAGVSASRVHSADRRAVGLKPLELARPAATLSWLPLTIATGSRFAHAVHDEVRLGAVADEISEHDGPVVAYRHLPTSSTASSASMFAWRSLRTR